MKKAKPDQFMPFFGNDFFQAVEGLSADIVAGYLRLIWYYWHHNGCKGLLNDDVLLRNIARIEREDWAKSKPLLLQFWTQEQGLWHQRRARELFEIQTANMNANRAKTEAARQSRWKK